MRIESSQATEGADIDRPISLLHVIGPAVVGGMERVVRSLAVAQHDVGHQVSVAAVLDREDPEHPFVQALTEAGVPVRAVVAVGRGYLRELRGVQRVCLESRPGIVHTHGRRSDVVAGLAARRVGIPTVATVHGAIGGTLRNRVYMRIQHRSLRKADAVVAVSAVIAEKLIASGVHEDRVHRVQNAWADTSIQLSREEARLALGLPLDAPVLGWVGRLSREKGADVFLDSLSRLQNSDTIASVLGEGREADSLRARAEQLGFAQRVRWYGAVADAGRLFRAFDVFVLSSHTEGTPMVLFEAMAARTPIVATRVGGVPDVVSSSEALLVPAGDPAALSEAIRSVLSDPAAAAVRATAAERRLHDSFGREAWVRAYDDVYHSALRNRLVTRPL